MGGRGCLVAVEGPGCGDGFVGSDRVVDRPVGGDLLGEFGAAGDVVAVEVLVFDGGEEAFDGAVGPRGAPAGAMWAMWPLAATQAPKRAEVKHDPLSVTRPSVATSPVAASVRSGPR